MSSGFNTDVRVGDRVFHVQTEDRGPSHPLIDTAIYLQGRVVHRHCISYDPQTLLIELGNDALHKRVEELIAKINGTVDKINAGQGTIGQLMVNPQLYDALTGATREFQSLAHDARANPKKFLTLRLTLF